MRPEQVNLITRAIEKFGHRKVVFKQEMEEFCGGGVPGFLKPYRTEYNTYSFHGKTAPEVSAPVVRMGAMKTRRRTFFEVYVESYLQMLDIPAGSQLHFKSDLTAFVTSTQHNRVVFEDTELSPTEGVIAMGKKYGFQVNTRQPSTVYLTYEDPVYGFETLRERYERFVSEKKAPSEFELNHSGKSSTAY